MPVFTLRKVWRALGAALLAVGVTCVCAAQQAAQILPPATPSATVLPSETYDGLPVHDIQIRGMAAPVPPHLYDLLAQKANEPLDHRKINSSIKALYATGRFSDVSAQVERRPDNEVTLVFQGSENYFIGLVGVDGAPKPLPRANQLVNASKLDLGELLTNEKLAHAMVQMLRVLRENGFYQAKISYTLQHHPETQQVDVFFHVQPGPAVRVGRLIVQGTPGLTEEQVRQLSKLHPSDRVLASRIASALQRLRKYYQKHDRLEAQVSIVHREYHPESNTLDYVFNIDEGRVVDINVEGAKLRRGTVKKNIPVYEEGTVDDDLLNEGRRNLLDYLQRNGYFDATVAWKKVASDKNQRVHIVYDVDRGIKHKLERLEIAGNQYFSTELILERMQVQKAGFGLSQGRFSQAMLTRDVRNIESLYKDNGFQQVKIETEVDDDYEGKAGRMRVVIKIDQGPQTRVASLDLEGVKSFPPDSVRQRLSILENQPYSETNVASDREAVINFYYNRGFPNVSMDVSAQPAIGDATRMNVTYRVIEGQQVFVDRVLLTGLDHTRRYIVDREVEVHDGDPLSQLAMLDTQRRLYDLGIFNQVAVAVQNPEGQALYKNVLLQVQEARRWTYTYGLGLEVQTGASPVNTTSLQATPAPGISTPPGTTLLTSPTGTPNPQGKTGASPRFELDITRLNFMGRDQTLSFQSHVGRLEQRGLFSFDAPRWLSHENWRLTFTTFYDNSRDVLTFTSQRLEASVQVEQVWSKATKFLYRFSYRRVQVDASTLVVDPNLIPLFSAPVRVGIPSWSLIYDKRDDPLDSHRGIYTTVDLGLASKAFGSQASFGRGLGVNSTYWTIKKKYVLARSTRIGVEEPFGSGAGGIVPLPERFFAGGSNTLRGFSINQAGPRDLLTGFPLGGGAMFINNLELRLPPPNLPYVGDNLSFVLFEDAGNVFDSTGHMFSSLVRWQQKNRSFCKMQATESQCNFNYLSHAVGTGIRYKTPIGPARLDFGYNLNPPSFPFFVQDANHNRIFQTGTLRHFNFSFSIGQTF